MNKELHPITPPHELVKQWLIDWDNNSLPDIHFNQWLSVQSARWGADQELEACVEWLGDAPVVWKNDEEIHPGFYLRKARRPSLTIKEQAQRILVETGTTLDGRMELEPEDIEVLRAALKLLPDEEV